MTAQTLAFSPKQTSTSSSWLNHCFLNEGVSQSRWDKREANTNVTPAFDGFWQVLAESLREGVLIVSRNIQPLYMNRQAKELCQILSASNRHRAILPQEISEICHQLIRHHNSEAQPLVMECQIAEEKTIRIRASWLNSASDDMARVPLEKQYILVFLENRNEILQEELQFEQQKYQLTDREMEIWRLLRQEYSYQDIAVTLHISLNTVKSHVKNIYAKKRCNQEQEKVLVSSGN